MTPENPSDLNAQPGLSASPRPMQGDATKTPAWVVERSAIRRETPASRPRWMMPAMLAGGSAMMAALILTPLLLLGGGDADAQSSLDRSSGRQPVATATAPADPLPAPFEVAQAQAPQSAWRLRCADTNDAATCNANQELFLNREVDGQQQNVGRLLNLTVLYLDAQGERLPFMSLQMPLGLDLRPGAVMQVDDGQEVTLEFLRCTNDGCDASVRLTPDLLGAMRAGSVLRVGFRPWGSEQVTAVEASLIGFTAAFLQLR